jgi:hypothetical protein
MLLTLKVIFATAIAACAVVLTISAGLVATHDPGERLSGVPSMSRPLVRQAIVEETEWQSFRLLAYSRRADELQRLRDLPTAPARAVVEYAERAQQAAEAAPAVPAPAPTVVATAPVVPPAPTAQPAPPSEPIISTPAEAAAPQPPPVVASAPAVAPPVATVAAPAPVEAPDAPAATAAIAQPAPSTQPAPLPQPALGEAPGAAADEPAPAASAGAQVAAIQSGDGATTAVKPADNPADAKTHHHANVKRHATHKKPVRVARTNSVPPVAKTGFPVELPQASTQGAHNSAPAPDTRQDSHARD